MLTNKKMTVLFIILLAVIFLLPDLVSAQATDIYGSNDLVNAGVNLGTRDLRSTIAGVINIFLGFLGILATLIIIYGGFIWMTSGGSAEKIDRAKRILINGVIGLVIILSSYAIARFILKEGYNGIFGGGGSGGGGGGVIGGIGVGAGALESHYPVPFAFGVPRNTNIYLTFKEPMDVSRIVADTSCNGVNCQANPGFINLYEQGTPLPITGGDLIISYSTDPDTGYRTFQINPYGLTNNNLGSNTANVGYRMELGDLQTQNGSIAFPYGNTYSWVFTTGTEFDFTPPKVVSVVPIGTANPRNTTVQINFSEAINPILAAGNTADGFSNIIVTDNDDDPSVPINGPFQVAGEYKISNQYRTVELVTTNLCGQNSCGGYVFCLPASNNTNADDFVAFIDGTGTVLAGNVIADMSDNILDGDNDDTAGGDYSWTFATTDEIDLVPPIVSGMQNSNYISLTNPIEMTFSKDISATSVNSSNISLTGSSGPINYWSGLSSADTVAIYHNTFDPASFYYPEVGSGIKDLRQNCWFPAVCDDPINASCVSNVDNSLACQAGTHCVGI